MTFGGESGIPIMLNPKVLSFQGLPSHILSYSNLGYMILGEVIENVTAQPYEIYMKYLFWGAGIYNFKLGNSDVDVSEVQ